jgi:formylglycine-generating enzyme required for sulfatase activity/tRNA A-37 threonylcarbamoyl transferase component Bud32
MKSPRRREPDFQTGLARRLDAACNRFEAQCQAGRQPRIEDFLEQVEPADRAALLAELLQIELHYRRAHGDQPTADEYHSRFTDYAEVVTAGFTAKASAGTRAPAALPRLPGYEVLGVLGAGGMGQVYKARHQLMNRIVALKVIRQERLADPTVIGRFQREVQVVAQLAHPNIVVAYDADQAGTTHFFVMEYVPGQALAQMVKQRSPLPVLESCGYIAQAACGLQHAHDHRLVHRDIKPANLIVNEQGVLKILDLGLARMTNPTRAGHAMTQEGTILGTVDFMAPEQAAGLPSVDIRADLYSLGCTLYYLLSGKVPYPDGSLAEKLIKLAQEEPVPLSELRPDVPRAVAAIVRKLMAKDPSQRYAEPAALVDAMDAVQRAVRRPRRLLRRLGINVGLIAVLAVVTFLVWPRQSAAPVDPEMPIPIAAPPPEPAIAPIARELAQIRADSTGPDVSRETLRDRIIDFCVKYAGQPQAYELGAMLPKLPRLTNSIGMKLAPIPPGKFVMGSRKDEIGREADDREWPPHEVEITRPFFLGAYPVTLGQFKMFVKATGYRTTAEDGAGAHVPKAGGKWGLDLKANWQDPRFAVKDSFPVVCVSWQDARNFCRWLSTKEGKRYTLPTEAQYEYACRAGSRTRYFFGDSENQLDDHAWHTWNSKKHLHAVGLKKPNPWGLYDMIGNVRHWCQDYYARDYYWHNPPRQDPTGPKSSNKERHVVRGGAWTAGMLESRSAWRFGYSESESQSSRGFRVVLLPAAPGQPAGDDGP